MLNLMHKKMSATTVNEISTTTIPTSTQNKRTAAIIADQKRRTSEKVSTIKFPKKPKSLKKTNPPKKNKTKDKNAPKGCSSAYVYWQNEIRAQFMIPGISVTEFAKSTCLFKLHCLKFFTYALFSCC